MKKNMILWTAFCFHLFIHMNDVFLCVYLEKGARRLMLTCVSIIFLHRQVRWFNQKGPSHALLHRPAQRHYFKSYAHKGFGLNATSWICAVHNMPTEESGLVVFLSIRNIFLYNSTFCVWLLLSNICSIWYTFAKCKLIITHLRREKLIEHYRHTECSKSIISICI